jgi:hypothetical protein
VPRASHIEKLGVMGVIVKQTLIDEKPDASGI